VDWAGDVEKHPVSLEILSFSASDQLGAEIRKKFEGPPFGWSGDAVDGAIYVLLATEHLRAFNTAGNPLKLSDLDSKKLGLAKFRSETVPVSPAERIGVRGLMQRLGVACKSGEEAANAPALLAELKRRGAAAGGEPPCPAPPSISHLLTLEGLAGNALIKRLYDQRDALAANVDDWDKRAKLIGLRKPRWEAFEAMLIQAAMLPIASELVAQKDALSSARGLLSEPDPLPQLCEKVTSALRGALVTARDAWKVVYDTETAALAATDAWQKLSAEKQKALLAKHDVAVVPMLVVGNENEVLSATKARSRGQWALDQAGLTGRFAQCRLEAVQLVAPKAQSVNLPKATLHDEVEVDRWLADVRAAVLGKLADGPVVV
jgi:hypothetical protein